MAGFLLGGLSDSNVFKDGNIATLFFGFCSRDIISILCVGVWPPLIILLFFWRDDD